MSILKENYIKYHENLLLGWGEVWRGIRDDFLEKVILEMDFEG